MKMHNQSGRHTGASLFGLTAVLLICLLAALPVAAEKVTINWWFSESDYIPNVFIPAFEKAHPNIDIEYTLVSGGKQDKILAAFLGGTAPDIFWGWPEERIMLPEAGMSLPLDRYLSEWDAYSDFFPGSWLSNEWKGKHYGIPFYLDLRDLLYRKDIFEEVGLDSSTSPQDWQALRDAAKKITRYDQDGAIVRTGLNINDSANDFAPFLWQAGGDFLTEDYTKANMTSKDSLRALEFYAKLALEDRVSPPMGTADSWGKAFWTGTEGMVYANAAVPFRVKTNMPDLYNQVGAGIPPMDKQRKVMLHADYFAISRTSKHPDEAFEVLKAFFAPDNFEKYSASTGGTPTRRSLMESDYALDNPVMLDLLKAAPYGRPQPPVKESPVFFDLTGEMLTNVLSGKVAPRNAAETFDQKMNAALAEMYKKK